MSQGAGTYPMNNPLKSSAAAESLSDAIASLPAPDRTTFEPLIFDAGSETARRRLAQLVDSGQVLTCDDTLPQQLRDLAFSNLRDKHAAPARIDEEIERILGGTPGEHFGSWVYYPWRRQLIHILPQTLFRQLRLDRNHHKITRADQQRLLTKTIGVVGLSVGASALNTMVLEGVGGHFKIADFDVLDLSNLNRLRASVADLQVSKVVLAARAAREIDPYLRIDVFPRGLNQGNMPEFFGDDLSLLVEECDDLPMKVRLREIARARGVPVVMETTDRGLVDVERFDLEPERPFFHGRLGPIDADTLEHARTRDRVPFVLGILDPERLSTSMAASLVEIEKTTYTWPQLASAVALGGALVTEVVRKTLLGTQQYSGRFYADLDHVLSREQALTSTAVAPASARSAAEVNVAPEARTARTCPGLPGSREGDLSAEEARFAIEHAIVAPSGGNCQPWRFELELGHGTIECFRAAERTDSFLDFGHWAADLAIGAAVTNLRIAAGCMGFSTEVEAHPANSNCVARVKFARERPPSDSPRRHAVFERVTCRHKVNAGPLPENAVAHLGERASALGLALKLVVAPDARRALGVILGAADRLRLQIRPYHTELMQELRWTPDEVTSTRTGIDLASLESSPAERAGLSVLRRWDVMDFLAREGLGAALGDPAVEAAEGCAAIGLLSAPSQLSAFESGRRLQELWLDATAAGLAWQPWAPLLAMYARARAGTGLSTPHQERLLDVGAQLLAQWRLPEGHAPLFMFRVLQNAPAPTARSLRLAVDAVIRARVAS